MSEDFSEENNYFCAPAVWQSLLSKMNRELPDQSSLALTMETASDSGTRTTAFAGIAQQFGLQYREEQDTSFTHLRYLLDQGWYVIVCYERSGEGHYALVQRIEDDAIVLDDPAEGPEYVMDKDLFVPRWRCPDEPKTHWIFAIKR